MLGANGDAESVYKSYVLPSSNYFLFPRKDSTGQPINPAIAFAAHQPKDSTFAFIMGHGHCDDVSGYKYEQITILINKYRQVAITGCGQILEQVERSFWRDWKCMTPERCPATAGKEKFWKCMTYAPNSFKWIVNPTINNDCKKLADNIEKKTQSKPTDKSLTDYDMWLEAQSVVLLQVALFRERVVFLTDRVLNLIDNGRLHAWLSPNDDQAARIGKGSADALGWKLDYNGLFDITKKPTPDDIKQFQTSPNGGGAKFNARLIQLMKQNEKNPVFMAETRLLQLTPIQEGIINMLSCPFNGAYMAASKRMASTNTKEKLEQKQSFISINQQHVQKKRVKQRMGQRQRTRVNRQLQPN